MNNSIKKLIINGQIDVIKPYLEFEIKYQNRSNLSFKPFPYSYKLTYLFINFISEIIHFEIEFRPKFDSCCSEEVGAEF